MALGYSRADYEAELDEIAKVEAHITRQVATGAFPSKMVNGLATVTCQQMYRLCDRAREIAKGKLVAMALVMSDRDKMAKSHLFLFVIGLSADGLSRQPQEVWVTRRKGALAKVNGKWQEVTPMYLAGRVAEGCTLVAVKGGFRKPDEGEEIDAQEPEVNYTRVYKPCSKEVYLAASRAGEMVYKGEGEVYCLVVYKPEEAA